MLKGTREKQRAARMQSTEARLDGLALPDGGVWSTKAREAALGRVRALGLPGRRDEYWKFTNPTLLSEAAVPNVPVFRVTDESMVFSATDRLRVVFVDGVFDPEASDSLDMAGLEIDRLADVSRRDIHWAKDYYGVLEAEGQKPVERPLAALNTAFASDGLLIRVTGRAERPVSLIYMRSDDAAVAEIADPTLHHVIRVEAGAELTVLENGPGAARFSQVMEVDIADGGTFHHVRAQGRDHKRLAMTHLFARLGAESTLKSFTLTSNGALLRNDAVVWLNGPGGVAHIAGAVVGDGDFHHDDTVFVTHAAPGCESRQVFKKVLRNGAAGVFQGKILVNREAQKTDGYQISQALLLDGDSQFLAKPELEIYADDVKCSHGSTSGEIDPDQLFYLRSRGVSEDEATMLLVLAFLAEALAEIDDERLAEDLRTRLEGWLHRHR